MVKLTVSLIKKKYLQHQHKPLIKDERRIYLKKITHLFMNEQSIDEINNFSICKNLKVIYLQRNFINKIENLNFAVNLTHLYLQHNEIIKISNLDHLINLKKLYLGHNKIAVIEGLENLKNLSDLHIEKQRLALGERLCFDPRTVNTLSNCLMHLNISDNQLISLSDINNFKKLTILEAQNNLISDIESITDTISSLHQLEKLFLEGNPVTKICRYRENIIGNSHSLITLDKKFISEYSRDFLQKFKIEKFHQSKKKSELTLSEDITNSLNLPPAFKRSVTRAMFNSINPQFSFPGISTAGDLKLQIFSPWTSSLSVKGLKNNHILPRPFWKNKTNRQQNIEK